MLDKIMNLLGYENINNILISKKFKTPNAEKIRCKSAFHAATGCFQDKVIINQEGILLYGFVTFSICKWRKRKYIKVLKVDITLEEYQRKYKLNREKTKVKKEK